MKLNLKSLFLLPLLFMWQPSVFAQLIPDRTLGGESSQVVPVSSTRDDIRGGARRGSNLFHSFREFNVNSGREVYFNNPSGVRNIINRVTGSNISNIFGTLGVNGNANLYLINPNGIVFGDGAKLDINGTFIGTTADGVRLGTNDVYSGTDPASSSLLTIQPGALFVNRKNAQIRAIINQEGLQVKPGGNLILSGDEIENNGSIVVPGGNIFLEAVNGNINSNNIDTSDDITGGGDITLSATGAITVNGSIDASGGDFNIDFNDSRLPVLLSNNISADSGNIKLKAGNKITFNNDSNLFANGFKGGSINLESQEGLVGSRNFITSISIENINGKGGDINVDAKFIRLNNSFLVSQTQGDIDTGNISIRTDSLHLEEGAQISASTFAGGDGGNLIVNAREIVILGVNRGGLFVQTRGEGNGGLIKVNTDSLRLKEGGQISGSTFAGGNGGNLIVNAREIEARGGTPNGFFSSGILSIAVTEGNAGSITIDTNLLRLAEGAQVNATTWGVRKGGNINISAKEIEIKGISINENFSTSISAAAIDFRNTGTATGDGGDINIVTEQLTIKDGATISVSNFQSFNLRSPGLGSAGNINIAAEEIVLDRGQITARGNIKGGGDISIDTSNFISLENESEISTDVGETVGFTGGNIRINTPIIIASPDNNRITARAITSMGGNINIDTNAILGYPQFLEIDASSALGIDGTINITGIRDLGSQFIQPEPVIISQTPLELAECPLNGQQTALYSRSSDRSLNKFKVEAFAIDNKSSTSENPKRLKPAVGWYRKTDGTVVLTDDPNKVRPLSMPIDYSTQCQK